MCALYGHRIAIVPEALHRSKVPVEPGLPALHDVAEINSMTVRKKIDGFTQAAIGAPHFYAGIASGQCSMGQCSGPTAADSDGTRYEDV